MESVFEVIDNLRPALHKLQVRVEQTAHLALLTAWEYFTHEHSHSRADRWGEDGIAEISDNHQRLCFAIALSTSKNQFL